MKLESKRVSKRRWRHKGLREVNVNVQWKGGGGYDIHVEIWTLRE
jgi:hypothetical protein